MNSLSPEKCLAELNDQDFEGCIASGGGRMKVTMDRYQANWGMVELGWKIHVLGEGRQFISATDGGTDFWIGNS